MVKEELKATAKESVRVIRDYQPNDREAVMEIIERVWGKNTRQDHHILWEWKHIPEQKPEYGDLSSKVMTLNDKVIGYTGITPFRIKLGGRWLWGGVGRDTFNDENARGTGIKLMRTMLEQTQFLLGSANLRTSELWKKISKQKESVIDHVVKRVHPIDPSELLKKKELGFLAPFVRVSLGFVRRVALFLTPNLPKGYTYQLVEKFPAEISDFCIEVQKSYWNMVLRDSKYLNWRYVGCPVKTYKIRLLKKENQIVGYCVTKLGRIHGRRVLLVLEMLAIQDREANFGRMIREVIREAIKLKVSDIQVLESGCPVLDKVLNRHLFLQKPEDQVVMAWVNFKLGFNDTERDEIFTLSNWFLAMGDGDFEFIFFDQKPSLDYAALATSQG